VRPCGARDRKPFPGLGNTPRVERVDGGRGRHAEAGGLGRCVVPPDPTGMPTGRIRPQRPPMDGDRIVADRRSCRIRARRPHPNPTGIDPDSALRPCPATDSSPSRTRVAARPHIAPVNQDHQLRPTQGRAHRRVSPQRAGDFAFNRGDAFFSAAVHQRDLAPQLPCARFRHRLAHLATVPLTLPDALRDPPTSKN
jgi:hypothetical protein